MASVKLLPGDMSGWALAVLYRNSRMQVLLSSSTHAVIHRRGMSRWRRQLSRCIDVAFAGFSLPTLAVTASLAVVWDQSRMAFASMYTARQVTTWLQASMVLR